MAIIRKKTGNFSGFSDWAGVAAQGRQDRDGRTRQRLYRVLDDDQSAPQNRRYAQAYGFRDMIRRGW
jgi:hypothetical protein